VLQRGEIAINVCTLQQAAYYHGFSLLLRIENSQQLLVRIRTLFYMFFHTSPGLVAGCAFVDIVLPVHFSISLGSCL